MKAKDKVVAREQGPDAFHGQGGSYVLDPLTGKRTLVERTLSREEAAAQEQAPVAPQAEEGGV